MRRTRTCTHDCPQLPQEFNGSFMVAFAEPCSAVEWGVTLQMALVAMAWPAELAACEQTAEMLDGSGTTVCR